MAEEVAKQEEERAPTEATPAYDPFSAMREEMNRMFERFSSGGMGAFATPLGFPKTGNTGEGFVVPSIDVKENDGTLTLSAELPGLSEDEVELVVSEGLLSIKGEKRSESDEEKDNVHVRERRYGRFERSFRLPEGVEEEKIDAALENGVLTVTIPKGQKPMAAERKIAISKG